MDDIPIEQLEQRFRALPETIQDALTSNEFTGRVVDIAERSGVSESQLEEVVKEVGSVLMGLTSPSLFEEKLSRVISLSPDQITRLVQEIDNQIIKPLTTEIIPRETHNPQQGSGQRQSVPNPPPNLPTKPDQIVHGGWKPDHIPNIQSVERPISSSLIKKQVEKKQQNEEESKRQEAQKPKPYWPDPYREPLGDE